MHSQKLIVPYRFLKTYSLKTIHLLLNSNRRMHKKIVLFFIFLVVSQLSFSQDSPVSSEKKQFIIAKNHLFHRRIKEALPILYRLQKNDSENRNLNYLIGVCLVEEEKDPPKAIYYLLNAQDSITKKYDTENYEERQTPIYTIYYLAVAYAQNGACAEAQKFQQKFNDVATEKDNFYVNSLNRWILRCKSGNIPNKVADNKSINKYVDSLETQAIQVDIVLSNEVVFEDSTTSIVTKSIEYTTNMPLYGVQVGAFKDLIPRRRFPDLKNVVAFIDKEGWIRYVIGHFAYKSQAESLQRYIARKGYPNSFVVDVNDASKYSEELVSINNLNVKAEIKGKVEYRIQLGAFTKEIPDDVARNFLVFGNVQVFNLKYISVLTSEPYATYAEAIAAKREYIRLGATDAFVVAFNKKQKIPLIDALNYTNENPINQHHDEE